MNILKFTGSPYIFYPILAQPTGFRRGTQSYCSPQQINYVGFWQKMKGLQIIVGVHITRSLSAP